MVQDVDHPQMIQGGSPQFFKASYGVRRGKLPNTQHLIFFLLLALYGYDLLVMLHSPHAPVSADAGSFWDAGQQSKFFYDSGWREPLLPLLCRLIAPFVGDGNIAVRWVSAIFSLAAAALVYFVAYRRATRMKLWAALPATIFWMSSPGLRHYAAQGDRLSAACFLFLLHAVILFQTPHGRIRTISLGIVGGLLPLLRSEALLTVIVMLAFRAALKWKDPSELRSLAISGSIMLILFAPYPATEFARTGTIFTGSAIHARFWANCEFAGRKFGMHQNLKEVSTDHYRGGPLSPREYILGMHSAQEVLNRYREGYTQLVTKYLPRYLFPVSLILILSAWGMVTDSIRSGPGLIVYVLAAHFPFAFIYPIDQVAPGSGVEARFALHTAAFWIAWAGLGIESIAAHIEKSFRARRAMLQLSKFRFW